MLATVTVKSRSSGVFRVTVATAVPGASVSLIVPGAMLTVSVGTSSSVTSIESVTLV